MRQRVKSKWGSTPSSTSGENTVEAAHAFSPIEISNRMPATSDVILFLLTGSHVGMQCQSIGYVPAIALHEPNLELHKEGILRERVGSGIESRCPRTCPQSGVMPELVIELDLGLDLGREILEVIGQTKDRSRVQVVRHLGVRIELLIHEGGLKIFQWTAGD